MGEPAARFRRTPTWLDSVLFVMLMSGPPKFRDRDTTASLAGQVDAVVLLHIVVWGCGALWVASALYPSLVRRGAIPPLNRAQVLGGLLIAGLSASLWHSPGFMLTAFTLGQFAIMLSFAWLFAHRFGTSSYLHHLFAGVCVITLMLIAAAVLTPDMVIVAREQRFRGERIAPVGAVAAMGLAFCLSNVPRLRSLSFWGMTTLFGILLTTSRMRTAYVGMVAFLLLGWAFGRGLRVRKLVPVLMALAVALLVMDAVAPTTEYLVRDTKSLSSMSDRVPLWGFLTRAVMRESPVVGFGYFAGSRVLAPQYNPGLGTAHSAFFEFLVGGGLVGAGLYVMLCAALLWYAGQLLATARGRPETLAAVGLLALALVNGIMSTEATHAGPVGFSFWSMTALLPALYREARVRSLVPAPRRGAYRSLPSPQRSPDAFPVA
jgi:O-antigen ligase